SGSLTASLTSDGALLWTDSKVPVSDPTDPSAVAVWPGTYTVSVTLARYAHSRTVVAAQVTLDCPVGAAHCHFDDPSTFTLTELGTVSGVVTGFIGADTTAPHQPVPNVSLSATLCRTGEDPATDTCTGASTPVAQTDSGGAFTMSSSSGGGGPALDGLWPGTWQLTYDQSTLQGYEIDTSAGSLWSATTSASALTVDSGANTPAAGQTDVFAKPTLFEVGLSPSTGQLLDCPAGTCTVTVVRTDTGQLQSSSTPSGDSRYHFTLYPATYQLSFTGPNYIENSTATYTIQANGPDTVTFDAPVVADVSTITGLVQAPTDQAGTIKPINGVSVDLGHVDGSGDFVTDPEFDGHTPLSTTTGTGVAGVTGAFTFSDVPNGTYAIRYNATTSDTGTLGSKPDEFDSVIAGAISVTRGSVVQLSNFTLTRSTRAVQVDLTTSVTDALASATTVTLTNASDSSWKYTLSAASPSTSGSGTLNSWSYAAVPTGNWNLSFTLPENHLASPSASGSSPGLTCTGGTDLSTVLTCTSSTTIKVRRSDETVPSTIDEPYTLDEYSASVSIGTAQRLTNDPSGPLPITVWLKVTPTGGTTPVYEKSAFPLSSTVAFFAPSSAKYSVKTASTSKANWQTDTGTLSSTNTSVSLTPSEISADVTVQVDGVHANEGSTVSVTLDPPTGSGITISP
ncbi:MAG: hypothetical protein INR72_18360, partial [Williamsia herbipolensis]|nr:hypothetical protein [Williamsia herbipolensis]